MEGILKLFGIAGGIIGLLGFILYKFAFPQFKKWIQIGVRSRYAKLLSHLADEITDDLVIRYPASKWINFIDEAVDELLKTMGWEDLSQKRMIVTRAENAALNRAAATGKITKKDAEKASEKLMEAKA